jgi:regulation of enolase protein 1 (concanavalin A-like superfamily)
MNLREFMRFHLLKALLVFIILQIAVVAIIQNYNHRPQAQPDQASVIENRSVKITPVFNDTDKDETDELSVQQVSKPKHGSVEQKVNLLYYKPDKGFIGTDSFTYTVSDGRKESKGSVITIRVNKDREPLPNRDIANVYSGGTIIIDVLKNDTDPEGDSIFITKYSQPQNGNITMTGNKFVYSSMASSAQADSFTYTISDGKTSSKPATAFIEIQSKSHPCYPWLSCNVGDPALPGSFSCMNNTFVIEASGTDIWNNADGFHYAYQYITGDCEMYTKVESFEGEHEWAKAGIMIRETLGAGSKNAFTFVTTRNGVTCQHRVIANNATDGSNQSNTFKAPYWVKIIRKGNAFTIFASADGQKWDGLENFEVPMNTNVYIGFAVTSHDNSKTARAIFSNYHLTGKVARFQRPN